MRISREQSPQVGTGQPARRLPRRIWPTALIVLLAALVATSALASGSKPAPPPGKIRTSATVNLGEVTRTVPAGIKVVAASTGTPSPVTSDLSGKTSGSKAWTTLFSDNFESGFPGSSWTLYNYEGDPYWGAWSCWSSSPSQSVGCAAAGTGAIGCGGIYPDYLQNWMVAGPFALDGAGITAAEVNAQLNLVCEANYDSLYTMASINGTSFTGGGFTGTYNDAITLDLAGFIGQPQVWIAFLFVSDINTAPGVGAQIDDVVLRVDSTTANQAPLVSVTAPNGGENWFVGATQNITYSASDPDGGPSPLTISLDYSTNGGTGWTTIATGQSNSGSYSWTVPDAVTTAARVRVTASDGADATNDSSDANFTIAAAGLNSVTVGDGSGQSGTSVTVSLSLDNEDAVKGIQADLLYDAAQAALVGVTATGRGAGLTAAAEQVAAGRGRVILYFDNTSTITAGNGVVANLTFNLLGAGGTQTALTPSALILAGPSAESLNVNGVAGNLTVSAPTTPPTVQLAVLENPGRSRSLQIMATVVNGSGGAPTVTAAGATVTMSSLGNNVYHGVYHAAQGATSVSVNALDTNANGTGTDQVTVSF
ncbi:MAG: cohesin domain-containing protein [bacterium]